MPLAKTMDSYTEEDYYNLPEDIRAELIDGQIYYQAAPSRIHQKLVMLLSKTIANYIDAKGGSCEVYPAPFAVKLRKDRKNIVEPDISVICDKNKLTKEGCLGAPDWIIEIVSPGNSSHDYVRKLTLYMDTKVREYWIVDPEKEHVIVYHLEKKLFDMTTYTFQDIVPVHIYDDFSIDFKRVEL
ncbi:MAG: Uma2 family endonuclease [Lachnospiraceae bacterium]|nr:Uma2 family endonuclease [Lachnospiraceae bacterium]